MSGRNPTPREIAARVLQRRREGDFIEHLLETALASASLPPADRHLCQEIVYGIVRWQATLDWLIDRKTDRRPQKPMLRDLLRMGLYQIFWLERIPPHAAVHETVELARREGFGPQTGFVNALLRGYLREAETTRNLLAELQTSHPHMGFSHPEWLVARWQHRFGRERAAELMRWNNTPPGLFARVNLLKTDAARLLPQWRDENVEYDFVRRDWFEENLVFELKSSPYLNGLGSFRDGAFYVQDPSTLLAVHELDPQPGDSVLDLCAAPGGKLTYAAQRMQNQGLLVAHDVSPERLTAVRENCGRLGVTCVRTALPSALDPSSRFGRILIDAPCSNTGVMRRRVDLRWRVTLDEVQRLRATQLELLRIAAPLLKPGGVLVYSTCSLEPEENRSVVDEFLAGNQAWRLLRDRELLPFSHHVDGAYVAVLLPTP